jgi:hypothetical protein
MIDSDNLPEPEDLITAAVDALQSAVDELNDVMLILQNGNGKTKKDKD